MLTKRDVRNISCWDTVGVSILWYEESIGSIPGECFGFLPFVTCFHKDLGCSRVLFHQWAGPGELGLPRREAEHR